MEINFKANLVNTTYVRKYSPIAKKFVPHEVSFVEINPRLKDDIKALKKMSKLWGEESFFASQISHFAKTDPRKRTFILTEQNDNYKKIEPEKILGITQLGKEIAGENCIEYLETNPKYQLANKDREFKKVGNCILDSLKKAFYNKTLKVDYLFDRTDFYLHNDFFFRNGIFSELIWKAQDKK